MSFFCIKPIRAAAIFCATLLSSPVLAIQVPDEAAKFEQYHNELMRINLAGRQRMLVQSMIRDACLVMSEINSDKYAQSVFDRAEEFENVLSGLQIGDATLGLAAETSEVVIENLEIAGQEWLRFGPAIRQVAAGDFHVVAVHQIKDGQSEIAKGIGSAVDRLVGYLDSESGSALSSIIKTINVAGRQRMLSQRALKEVCFETSGIQVQINKEAFRKTVKLFEASMEMLINGSSEHGIIAPRSAAQKKQLLMVNDMWIEFKELLYVIEHEVSLEDLRKELHIAAEMSDNILHEMNQAVLMYFD